MSKPTRVEMAEATSRARTTRSPRAGNVSTTRSPSPSGSAPATSGSSIMAHRPRQRLDDREDRVQPRDLEDLPDPGVGHDNVQLTAELAAPLERADEDSQRGRVEKRDSQEVEHHRRPAPGDHPWRHSRSCGAVATSISPVTEIDRAAPIDSLFDMKLLLHDSQFSYVTTVDISVQADALAMGIALQDLLPFGRNVNPWRCFLPLPRGQRHPQLPVRRFADAWANAQ